MRHIFARPTKPEQALTVLPTARRRGFSVSLSADPYTSASAPVTSPGWRAVSLDAALQILRYRIPRSTVASVSAHAQPLRFSRN